ncbi:hypothetical protein C8R45DRAFT_190340 [Mycena sanguinolenta]|nr:hypothetical protein C8R45DRAFT_190340 [Mycena sanguinolenta]
MGAGGWRRRAGPIGLSVAGGAFGMDLAVPWTADYECVWVGMCGRGVCRLDVRRAMRFGRGACIAHDRRLTRSLSAGVCSSCACWCPLPSLRSPPFLFLLSTCWLTSYTAHSPSSRRSSSCSGSSRAASAASRRACSLACRTRGTVSLSTAFRATFLGVAYHGVERVGAD